MQLQKLNKTLKLEYDALVKEGVNWCVGKHLPAYRYFLDHAYEFAHYNEIIAFFENMEEETYNDDDWKKQFSQLNPFVNILQGIYLDWLDYNHPENFNFFTYGDLEFIIRDWLKREIKK